MNILRSRWPKEEFSIFKYESMTLTRQRYTFPRITVNKVGKNVNKLLTIANIATQLLKRAIHTYRSDTMPYDTSKIIILYRFILWFLSLYIFIQGFFDCAFNCSKNQHTILIIHWQLLIHQSILCSWYNGNQFTVLCISRDSFLRTIQTRAELKQWAINWSQSIGMWLTKCSNATTIFLFPVRKYIKSNYKQCAIICPYNITWYFFYYKPENFVTSSDFKEINLNSVGSIKITANKIKNEDNFK